MSATSQVQSASSRSTADFFKGGGCDVAGFGSWLDELGPAARLQAVRALTGGQEAKLFEAAKGRRHLTIEDFVPTGVAPLVEVIHEGKNSMPVASHFQKRFCRTETDASVLWGYNEQALRAFSGPGYFVAHADDRDGIVIDYYMTPPEGASLPAGWPKVASNTAGLSRFIYGKMHDYMRAVSKHVTIGRAERNGHDAPNWFALCRTI